MTGSKTVKIAISTLVLGLAFSAMLYSSLSEDTQYYKHVDEVMGQPAEWYGKRLQLHGHASDIRRKPDSLDYRFEVAFNGQMVQASYNGIVPDTFKDGSEVVVKGTLGPDGFVVEPNGVMAKCPSKYEAGKSGAPGRSPGVAPGAKSAS
ncbi:cytochrome c maturation protein CcmE [Luteitalea sp.]